MAMGSSPISTSLTTSRTIRWRSMISSVIGTAQACQERRESFRQPQEGGLIVGLVSDRLQFSTKRLFTLTQRGYSLTQLFDDKSAS